jgi:hypothetical protein
MPIASPAEVQAVKDALLIDAQNVGIGIYHELTDRVFLAPFDNLRGGGHAALVVAQGLRLSDCKGFVVGRSGNGWTVLNVSHLNGPQGQPGSLAMPLPLFASIELALHAAGL